MKATFEANFSNFNSEVEKSIAKLKEFGLSAEGLNQQLASMTEQLRGDQVVTQAMLMAKAIENVGGVTKLTAKELQTMGNLAKDAQEKLTALGQTTPPEIGKYVKYANDELERTPSLLTRVAGTMATVFSAREIINFTGKIIDNAQSLRALSNETGITTEDLQVLGHVTDDYGVSAEQMGRIVEQLEKRVGGRDQGLGGALHTLGLSFDDVKGKAPLDLLTQLADRANRLTDPFERAAALTDLFGTKAGAALMKVGDGLQTAIEAGRNAPDIIPNDAIQRTAKLGEEWDKLKHTMLGLGTEQLDKFAKSINDGSKAAEEGLPWWKALGGTWADYVFRLMPGMEKFAHVLDAMKSQMSKKDVELPAEWQGPKLPAGQATTVTLEKQVDAILKDQIADWQVLTEAQRAQLDRLYDAGQLNAANAEATKLNVTTVMAYKKHLDDIVATQVRNSEQLKAWGALHTAVTTKAIEQEDKLNAKAQERFDAQQDYLNALGTQNTLREQQAGKALGEAGRGAGVFLGTEFDAAMKRFQDSVDALADANREVVNAGRPALDQSRQLAAAFKTLDDDLAQLHGHVAPASAGEAITPWSTLAPKAIGVKPIGVRYAGEQPGAGGITAPTTVNVSGVLDPRTINELAAAVSKAIMSQLGRPTPNA